MEQQLREEEKLVFNNFNNPESEAIEIELDFGQISTWDDPFKLWVNGQLEASFKTFSGIQKRAKALIDAHKLEVVR